jgi:hypothetical protein
MLLFRRAIANALPYGAEVNKDQLRASNQLILEYAGRGIALVGVVMFVIAKFSGRGIGSTRDYKGMVVWFGVAILGHVMFRHARSRPPGSEE